MREGGVWRKGLKSNTSEREKSRRQERAEKRERTFVSDSNLPVTCFQNELEPTFSGNAREGKNGEGRRARQRERSVKMNFPFQRKVFFPALAYEPASVWEREVSSPCDVRVR